MSSSPKTTWGLRVICALLVVVGLFAAGFALKERIHAENSMRAVELMLDYSEIVTLAGQTGMPMEATLKRLKDAGANAVAVQEETLNTLNEQGMVQINPPEELMAISRAYSPPVAVNFPNPQRRFEIGDIVVIKPASDIIADFVEKSFRRMYPASNIMIVDKCITVRGSRNGICDIGLGLFPSKVTLLSGSGLHVVPRLRSGTYLNSRNLPSIFESVANVLPPALPDQPRGLVVFDGTMLPGYRTLIPQLKNELQKNNLVYGSIEFGKQKGDDILGKRLNGDLVRVHSISLEELAAMTPQTAVQRFELAVKDRNIRAIYVHLPPVAFADHGPEAGKLDQYDQLKATEGYISSIAGALNESDFVVGGKQAHPFAQVSLSALFLTLLFIAAGSGLLMWLLVCLPAELPRAMIRWALLLLFLGVAGAVVTAFLKPDMGRTIFGLLAAIGFPLLSLTWAYRYLDHLAAQKPKLYLLHAVAALLISTAITIIGALLIAAMMTDSRFLVKVLQFTGVKATLAVPLLLFAALIITDGVARAGESYADYCRRVRERTVSFFSGSIPIWGMALGLVALAVLALMIMRSGNEGNAAVSGSELHLRSMLEQWLVARPRTKEFAFGHPLFLLGMALGARGYRQLGLLLLLGGMLGQADVLNTYCHAHTPFLMSLLRSANGLWLGIIIGVALAFVLVHWVINRGDKMQDAGSKDAETVQNPGK